MELDLKQLRELAAAYTATLEDQEKDEWWCTHKSVAEAQLRYFFEFLEAQQVSASTANSGSLKEI